MENVCSGRKGSEISRVKSHPHAVGSIGLFCLAAGSWEESAGAMWLSRNHPLTPEFSSLNSLGWSSALSQRGRFWSKIWWFLQEKEKCRWSDLLFAFDKLLSRTDAHWDAMWYPANTLSSSTCQQANWQQCARTKRPVLNMLHAYIRSELH